MDMTSSTPAKQETEQVLKVNMSKKQGIDTMEANELMAANEFATLFCCFCLGLAGTIMAYKSRNATNKGRADSAKSYLFLCHVFLLEGCSSGSCYMDGLFYVE